LTATGASLTIEATGTDKNTMKSVITISAALVVTFVTLASAQTVPQNRPLADVARDEEARRKQTRKPARVITNSTLTPDITKGIGQPSVTATPAGANATPANATPAAPENAGPAKDQAYWTTRIRTARELLQRTQIFMDSLQTRINSLTTDFVNRDDPAQRAKIETDRQQALAELERVKKELTDQQKAITAIEEEARRAGVPSGWLRPGA
jgi:hypothetical protein